MVIGDAACNSGSMYALMPRHELALTRRSAYGRVSGPVAATARPTLTLSAGACLS
jgi:hypothetical protein